ncbi:MAG: pyridoxal-dependent decarboxylase [Chloroflexota bacterium]|nr:pyridoxal-dependent decarboxylase [Chloroflexota bacterium]
MYSHLAADLATLPDLLDRARAAAVAHLNAIDSKPPAAARGDRPFTALPTDGLGAAAALDHFLARYGGAMAAGSGSRYWGFVTGGSTPAALMGDWLASAYDINLADRDQSEAPGVELEAIALLRDLFGLPDTFNGVFVSGATMSNLTGLAMGREWASRQSGVSASVEGMYAVPPIPVLAAAAHSSIFKTLAILGMGRSSVTAIAKLPGQREAIDVGALETALSAQRGAPAIVVASAGTVNTVDFDDLAAIAALKDRYNFWLHVDAAFGGFAACSPRYAHLMRGVEGADSLTIDAHKWLNVPYDSGMIFTQHVNLQTAVFQNSAAYLPELGDNPEFFHLTPENSRRFRALPAWFTLMAYGRAGYAEIVERNCDAARLLADRIAASAHFRLLAPARMNVICFTIGRANALTPTREQIAAFLNRLRDDGRVFLTPTVYDGVPGVRAAFSNWRTTLDDVAVAWDALVEMAGALEMGVQ